MKKITATGGKIASTNSINIKFHNYLLLSEDLITCSGGFQNVEENMTEVMSSHSKVIRLSLLKHLGKVYKGYTFVDRSNMVMAFNAIVDAIDEIGELSE